MPARDIAYLSGEIEYGPWTCGDSGIAPHTWSVCFGTSADYSDDGLQADGKVDGVAVVSSGVEVGRGMRWPASVAMAE